MCTPQEAFHVLTLSQIIKRGVLDVLPLHEGAEDSPERTTHYVIVYPGPSGPIPVGQIYAPGVEHDEFAKRMAKLMAQSIRNILDTNTSLSPEMRTLGERVLAEAERGGLAVEPEEAPAPDDEWLRNLLDR